MRRSTYDKRPIAAHGSPDDCRIGWQAIAAELRRSNPRVVVCETYPGVDPRVGAELARALGVEVLLETDWAFKPVAALESLFAPDMSDDPVFGRRTERDLLECFDAQRLDDLRRRLGSGPVLVFGVGASLVSPGDRLVYADMPRWEIQQRQRRGVVANLGGVGGQASAAARYKRGFFVDWPLADRHKWRIWDRIDAFLDTLEHDRPKMVPAAAVDSLLRQAAHQPFRMVPLFDPAPWGGQWMKDVCDLPRDMPNYGWCFDCVPEENSILLGFGAEAIELPALDLVHRQPQALLGETILRTFGVEFPIRFDFLDTVGGGPLSLQVHPSRAYMRQHFGFSYTQDESYYILDATPDAYVHLGWRDGVSAAAVRDALEPARHGGSSRRLIPLVARHPARPHDHFLIPAGTVHGSGAGCLVLEISATPYLFTFKLHDWDRPGLDGRPRPLHLDHGLANLRFERDAAYARRHLVNRITPLAQGDGWRGERTGLHADEPLETVRHWFTRSVPHATGGTLHVLNLVAGEAAVVESEGGGFEPFVVHYAETFIVPASVGAYTIRPHVADPAQPSATICASVRDGPP